MIDPEEIKRRLRRHDCRVAENHLDQAASALSRGEWESASAQVRTGLEALFDRVAEIRLQTAKRAGAARKELEEKGLLTDKQAKLVQAFMDYAGAGGSHAGRSTPDEAQGRYLVGLGLVLVGLNVLPELVRVEEVWPILTPPLSDSQVTTACRTCGAVQTLADCEVQRDGTDTTYTCRNGCQVLVVVGSPGESPWPGRGYRLGEYVIRNASDLLIRPTSATAQVLVPASPAALMKKRTV